VFLDSHPRCLFLDVSGWCRHIDLSFWHMRQTSIRIQQPLRATHALQVRVEQEGVTCR
jgi:hypothetical protein